MYQTRSFLLWDKYLINPAYLAIVLHEFLITQYSLIRKIWQGDNSSEHYHMSAGRYTLCLVAEQLLGENVHYVVVINQYIAWANTEPSKATFLQCAYLAHVTAISQLPEFSICGEKAVIDLGITRVSNFVKACWGWWKAATNSLPNSCNDCLLSCPEDQLSYRVQILECSIITPRVAMWDYSGWFTSRGS